MRSKFKIISITADHMLIEPQLTPTCTTCNSKSSCVSLPSFKKKKFTIPAKSGVVVGDFIIFEIPNKTLYSRAFFVYILPLIFLFVSAQISNIFYPFNELAAYRNLEKPIQFS